MKKEYSLRIRIQPEEKDYVRLYFSQGDFYKKPKQQKIFKRINNTLYSLQFEYANFYYYRGLEPTNLQIRVANPSWTLILDTYYKTKKDIKLTNPINAVQFIFRCKNSKQTNVYILKKYLSQFLFLLHYLFKNGNKVKGITKQDVNILYI